MLPFVAARSLAFAASVAWPWLTSFATRLIARRLDVPEIVVHAICLYFAAYVREVERNAALVCPIRVLLDLRRNRSAAQASSSSARPCATRAV